MTKKLNYIFVQKILKQRGFRLFSKIEFRRLFQVSESATTFFLFRHTHDGLLVKVKNGLYALADNFPSEEEIANRLYQPSYLSFEYVLARHGVIPEAVYSLTSATPKPSRRFEVEGKSYEYYTIKRAAYSGYQLQQIGGRLIHLAIPEKALVDLLYFVHLKKRSWNDRLETSGLSKKVVLSYAHLFGRPGLMKLVRELL